MLYKFQSLTSIQFSCQFQPVRVKDKEQRPPEKSGKLVANGRRRDGKKPPVSSVETSSETVTSEAST